MHWARDLWSIVAQGRKKSSIKPKYTACYVGCRSPLFGRLCNHSAVRPLIGWRVIVSGIYCAGLFRCHVFWRRIKLVAVRGQLMQELCQRYRSNGGHFGTWRSSVVNICAEVAENEVVSAVNFNAPANGHCCNLAAVERAMLAAKDAGPNAGYCCRLVCLLIVPDGISGRKTG